MSKNCALLLRILDFLRALRKNTASSRQVIREIRYKIVQIHHYLYINKSALIQQIFRILKALPRLDLIRI